MKTILEFSKVAIEREYDVTIFQTPKYGQKQGYKQVYRLKMQALNHEQLIQKVFRTFNVTDLLPDDYNARFIGTGDILFIDEGLKGQTYYRLTIGGWMKINRVHVR